MTQNRYYSNGPPSTLAAGLGAVTPGTPGTVEVADNTGWPAQFPFTLLIDWGSGSFEAATVTQAATGTGPFTYANTIRGDDNTLAPSHSSGAQAVPGVSARDFTEAARHVNGFTSGMAPSGITGATAASRYVGATASGHPATGTFAAGDYVVDQSGAFWVCTSAGTPGTWTEVSGTGGGGAVSSVFTRTGAVTAQSGDYAVGQVTGAAPVASPALTGTPTAPTAPALTGNTQVATTAYADSAVAVEASRATTAEALLAPRASPALTGTPTAPTQTTGDASTKIATDAFVATAVATETSRAETAEGGLVSLTGNQSVAGIKTFTGEIVVPAPVSPADAATKSYVDATAQGLDVKASVKAAATSAVTLSGTQTIDGVAAAAGDRVLATGQATTSQNGLWTVAAGAWTRPADFGSGSVQQGAFVFVEGGTANSSSGWVMAGTAAVTVDTTAQAWTQFSGAGEVTAGTGLSKAGNTLSLAAPVSLASGGTGQTAASAAALLTALGALQAASNLSDVASASTARTSLGLGSAATQPSSAFDAAGLAAAAEAASLPLTGGTLTGGLAVEGALLTPPVTLTDATSITVNAAASNLCRVTLGGNRTLANPGSPADGQALVFEVIQDATGSRTLAYGTAYSFPASIGTPVLSTTAGFHDFLAFRYDAAATTWYCVGFTPQQGAASPLTVAQGGTGLASLTAFGLLAGGTTPTGAVQQAGTGTAGQLLGSGGAGALPSFQSLSALGVQAGQPSPAAPVSITNTTITSIAGYTVPANDPAIGAIYRLTCYGFLVQGGTTSANTFGLTWGGTSGTSLLTNNPQVSPTISITTWFMVEAFVTFVTASTCNAIMRITSNTGTATGYAGSPHMNGTTAPVTVTVSSPQLLSINATVSNTTLTTTFTSLGAIAERVS